MALVNQAMESQQACLGFHKKLPCPFLSASFFWMGSTKSNCHRLALTLEAKTLLPFLAGPTALQSCSRLSTIPKGTIEPDQVPRSRHRLGGPAIDSLREVGIRHIEMGQYDRIVAF